MKRTLLVTLLLVVPSSAHATEDNPVFKSLKYGIFVHHAWGGTAYALTKNPDLSVPKSVDEVADSFDIKRFVKDLQAFRPEYISFTAWHASMNTIFPSAAMDKWRGKGHAARRDVIGELIRELKPTGIKLFLYVHPSDGHDMLKADQDKLGWDDEDPKDRKAKFSKWNNFMNEVFDEMCARYGKDVCGYWVDGGWERIDVKRLKATVWKYNPQAEFVSGMDNAGWCGQFNQLCPPAPQRGIPAATPTDVNTWPCFVSNVNLLQGGCWWTTGGHARMSPETMLKYTVLQAGCNTSGGGVGWAADCYTDGTWEPMVREYFVILGQLLAPIQESLKNSHPSPSYVTRQGSRIATLPHGIVATRSADGLYEYIHVLRPPLQESAYVHTLQLPPPADCAKFTNAVALRSGREIRLTQDDKGVRFALPPQDAWDPIDTVIKVTVQPGYGLLSRGKKATMSGALETAGWPLANATDGDPNTGWSSEQAKAGDSPWVMVDLEQVAKLSRVHLNPRVFNDIVGWNFPVDLEFSVSSDAQTFTTVLTSRGYKVTSPQKATEDLEPVSKPDNRRENAGQEPVLKPVLALSATGRKSSADYPQYFILPDGTKGRYVKITGTRLKDEQRMQFTEIEVFGSRAK
jgi:hypothetical protein